MDKITDHLGSGKIDQKSIDEYINLKTINEIFLNNLNIIDTLINKNDEYAVEFFDLFKKSKQLSFPVNKHIELYIYNNRKNLKNIIKYAIFRYKFYISGKKKINLGYPPYLLVEPVSTCNLRCPFCYQIDKSFTKKPFMGVMKFELFKKIIDEADEIGVGAVTIASRGEPTMHKKYIDMLEYVSKKENIFEIKTNTNGTFLNEEICHAIFKNNITQIIVSSDHYIKEHYEKLRLGSNFEKVVKNVDMLYQIRKDFYPDSITEIRISGIDNERNLNRKKFKEFWIKRSDHVTAGFPLKRWDTYNNDIHSEIIDPCEYLWDRMYVWFDGKVNPCDADYKSYLSYGDANKKTLKELWNDKIITDTRKKHNCYERNKINPCDRCGVTFA